MRLFLVRHGESEANIAQRINDDPARPVALTPRGMEQARRAAERLATIPFLHAYCSEFLRARQTAEQILAGRPCPLAIDPRLNERRSGMDGQHVDRFNHLVRDDPLHVKPPSGESFIEQMARVGGLLDDLQRCHPADACLLLVSHENPIQALRAVAGMDPLLAVRTPIGNCEWIELTR